MDGGEITEVGTAMDDAVRLKDHDHTKLGMADITEHDTHSADSSKLAGGDSRPFTGGM